MSESADSRHQHHADHADPPQVPSDDRDRARDEARRWVRRKRIFSTIVGVYLALSLMWFVIDMLDDSTGLWFYWPMLGTGLVVVVTGLGMFGLGGLFGADWERRQLRRQPEQAGPCRPGPPVGHAARRQRRPGARRAVRARDGIVNPVGAATPSRARRRA